MVALLLAGVDLSAQSTDSDTPPQPAAATGSVSAMIDSSVTVGVLESRIKEAESSSEIDDAAKAKLIELYRKALSSLESVGSYNARAAAYARSLEMAASETGQLRERINLLQGQAAEEPQPLADGVVLRDIEQRLAKEQADAAVVEAKLNEMEKALENWSQRPVNARQRISEARVALEELEAESSRPTLASETPALADARKWVQESRQRELRAELLMLDGELLSHDTRGDLLRVTRDKTDLDHKDILARKRFLEEQLNQRRQEEAHQARVDAQAATRAASDKHALVRELAKGNRALTEELSKSTDALDRIDDELAEIQSRAKRMAEEYRSTRQRIELSGLTKALGQVLLDRRQKLPDQGSFRRAAREREAVMADTNLRQIRLDEEQKRLRDIDVYINEMLATVPTAEADSELRAELREQLDRRTELLVQTREAEDAYLRALGELDFASGGFLDTVSAYDDLLAERLLWVRSAPPMGLAALSGLPYAVAWLLSPTNWVEVGQVLLYEVRSSPLLWLLMFGVLSLLWKGRSIRRWIIDLAAHLRRVHTDAFVYTLQALALTALLALPWPLLLAALGWQLQGSVEATRFTKAVGEALSSVSFGLFSLRFFSLLCIPGGVADRHFRWSGNVLKVIRRTFAWGIGMLVPIAFCVSLLHSFRDQSFSGSLGRVTLIALMIALAVFTARLVHPRKGVFQNIIHENPDSWVSRMQQIWYSLTLAMPLVLVGLALAGYTYTAGTLLESLAGALSLVLVLTVLQQSIVRWLIVTHRRLALRAVEERHAAAVTDGRRAERLPPGADEEVDLAGLDEQTRRLINAVVFVVAAVGLWAILSGVLPAFAGFEDVTLWRYTGMVGGEEKVIQFTLASVGLILAIVVLASIAARNLPALLEILLLQRISVSSGSRYTVKTIAGYLIAAGAAMMVFSTLGLSWGQVQWLVAALGLGIGFGLQEIVANFISGIIILFERPVRVGDIVTIGDTTGVVTRIQIRATTIRNWEKQELLVPNKELITGRLLNWTLSDTVNRVVVNVGVDYGNDVRLAMRLLEEAVRAEERVLKDPEPVFSFEGFGDNALNLVARCYLGSMDYRISVTTALHHAINDRFQAHGISIAYPQRDVHLSADQPLDVRVRQVWPESGELGGSGHPRG